MSTPLGSIVTAVAETWEAVTPGGDRPTFGYRRSQYKPESEDPEDDAAQLEDREFVFDDPVLVEENESSAGIDTVLRTYVVDAVFGFDTADLGNLPRITEVAEHQHAIRRAIEARAQWPLGAHEVVFDGARPRRTPSGDTVLAVRLLVSVWET